MTALPMVAFVKTVRFHGWGMQTWAPPALPWYFAAMVVGVLSLGCGTLAGLGVV
jgi:hypothetical protein